MIWKTEKKEIEKWLTIFFLHIPLQAVAVQSWNGKKIGSRSSHIRHLLLFLKHQISVCFHIYILPVHIWHPLFFAWFIPISLRLNPGLHTSGTIWHCDYVFHICIKVFFGRLWTNLFKMYFYSLTGLCRLVQQDFYSSESVKWFPPSLLLAYLTNISRFHTHFVSKSYQSIKGGEIWIIGATGYICSKRQCNIIEYWWNIKPHINHAVNIRKGQSIFWFWFLWKQHWQ